MFPEKVDRFVDIFGGSGAVLLGRDPAKFEVYNDIDSELVNLFRVARNRIAELLLELDLLPLNSREEFDAWLHFHDGANDPTPHLATQFQIIDCLIPKEWAVALKAQLQLRVEYKDVRQASAFFQRTRHSYASSGRSFACQPLNIKCFFDQLEEMSKRLENVIVEHQSFERLIPHYDREDTFFYGDPPYCRSEYVYEADFGWEQHVLLRDTLAACKGKWLISQADFPEVRELFKDYFILEFKRVHSMAQRTNPGSQFGELLIGNYDLLEREKAVPAQMSFSELMGQPEDETQLLKERIIPCKNRK